MRLFPETLESDLIESTEMVVKLQDIVESQAARIAELEAERDNFHMEYRMKCDVETKQLHEELAALRRKIDDAPAGWLECIPYERGCDHLDEFNEVGQAYADGWNACRKAMLAVSPKPGG
jgi:hypothetical protein